MSPPDIINETQQEETENPDNNDETRSEEDNEVPQSSMSKKRGRPKGSTNQPKIYKPTEMTLRRSNTKNTALISISDPGTIEEALEGENRSHWKEAIEDEMLAHAKNRTWTLTQLPKGKKTIKSKWVFKTKLKADGSIDRYKARLVAKGFTQKPGIYYQETFSPVVRYDSVRVIMSLASHYDMEMIQFDVKTAFLYGDLEEEIFMTQPEGKDDGTGRVCLLKKGLYGLKQAPRCWNTKVHSFLTTLGMTRSQADQCVYFHTRHRKNHTRTVCR
jgi:hypothetical protein